MSFKNITCKLGNMRKPAEFVLYPQKADAPDEVIIQADKRIAKVNMATGKAMLSSGKGGHQGFMALSPVMGAVEVDVPADVIAKLKELTGTNKPGDGIGSVVVMGK